MTDKVGIVFENDPNEKIIRLMWSQHKLIQRIARAIRDYSKPVDEYDSQTTPFPGPLTIVPAFSSQVRIESVTASLPTGITAANLQLGDRNIPLYSGAALATQLLVNLQNQGIILVGADNRILSFTGAPTSGYYIALNGHQLGNDK